MPPTPKAGHLSETTLEKSKTYKGHPQDPPAEMLKRMKTFLADEDPNRCLNFVEDRLPQIEGYIQYLADEHLIEENDKNAQRLFKDIKTMAEVQRDWLARADASPVETTCCDTPAMLNYSTRLQSLETVEEVQVKQEQVRLATQMRGNHSPVTVESSADQLEFLNDLLKDAQENREEMNAEGSLTYFETRAYDWALKQPSLIPYWMHRRGLPYSGQPRDKTPWNRIKTLEVSSQDSELPGYLKDREDKINRLLAQTRVRDLTEEENESLGELLYIHEPPHIKKVHDDATRAVINHAWSSAEDNEHLKAATDAFKKVFKIWIDKLAQNGVVLKSKRGGRAEIRPDPTLPPGIWHMNVSQPSEQAYVDLQCDENRINELIQTHDNLHDCCELRDLLIPYLPSVENMARDLREAFTRQLDVQNVSLAAYKNMAQADIDILYKGLVENLGEEDLRSYYKFVNKFEVFCGYLAMYRPHVELQYSRLGEMVNFRHPEQSVEDEKPVILYRLWDPDLNSATLPVDIGRPGPRFGELETRLNGLLYRDILSRSEEKELERLLQNVMPPLLRILAANYLLVKKRQPAERKAYEDAYFSWRDSLRVTGVKLRIPVPGHEDSRADYLCYRNRNDLPEDCGGSEDWAVKVQDLLRDIPEYDEVKMRGIKLEDEPFYALLDKLQYPALKRLDVAWRKVSGDNPEHQELREDLKDQWMRTFLAWIKGYGRENAAIHIRQGGAELDSPYPPNDPSVVYYHGPLHDGEPDTLLPSNARDAQKTTQKLLDRLALKLPLSIEEWQTLEKKICHYWQPGKSHIASQNLNQDNNEGAVTSYKAKFSLFIRACAVSTFILLRPWYGEKSELIAHDPTSYLSKDWNRAEGAAPHGFVSQGGNYKERLKQLWPYPRQFFDAISDMEQEIDKRLGEFREARTSTAADYSYFVVLLNSFLTPELRRLEGMIKRSKNAKEKSSLRSLFNEIFLTWVTRLEKQRLKSMIRIRDVDPVSYREPFPSSEEGVLFFERPFRKSEATPLAVVDLPTLPDEWLAVETTINKLLKRFHYRKEHPDEEDGRNVFTWEDDDELRRNLRAVMDHRLAEADTEFRSLEDRYRNGLLQGQELADYLTFAADWRQRYEEWVSAMPKSGIRLRKMTRDSPLRNSENIYDLYLNSPDELPPKFQSGPNSRIPQDVVENTLAINDYLATRDDWEVLSKDKALPYSRAQQNYNILLRTLWRPTRRAIIDKYSRNESISSPGKTGIVIPDKLQEFYRKVATKALLRQKFITWYNSIADRVRNANSILEVYERVRGETRLRERKAEAKPSQIQPRVLKSLVASSIKGWDIAWLEFVILSLRVFNGAVTPAELEHIKSSRKSESLNIHLIGDSEDRPAIAPVTDDANEGVIDLEIAKRNATIAEGAEEYRVTLKLLWRVFDDLNSKTSSHATFQRGYVDTLNNFDPIDELLLKHDLVEEVGLTLVPAPTGDELQEIETELNNMLYESGNRSLTQEQEAVLNYLLRPLLRGELDGLFRNLVKLYEKSQDDDEFISTGQSVALSQYSREFTHQFENWKSGIRGRGIILDRFYLGTDFDRVVSRHRRWKATESKSKKTYPTIVSTYFKNPLFVRAKKQYELLREYMSDPHSGADFSGLALPAMPQPLKITHDEWHKHNAEMKEQLVQPLKAFKADELLLTDLCYSFVDKYVTWFSNLPSIIFQSYVKAIREKNFETSDFSGKAERRGVQRAAIELGLGLLARNEEQHRPGDKFRQVKLPTVSRPIAEECPLSQSILPCERPVEMDPLEYTKRMRRYRQWKNDEYLVAQQFDNNDRAPEEFPAPHNYNGPKKLPLERDYQKMLAGVYDKLIKLQHDLMNSHTSAPRPLLRQLLELIDQGIHNDTHELLDTEWLRQSDFEVLHELSQPSWIEGILPYASGISNLERYSLEEFEQDISNDVIWRMIPFWETTRSDAEGIELREQRYEKGLGSNKSMGLAELLRLVNNRRAIVSLRQWKISEATRYVAYMSSANRLHVDKAEDGTLKIARIPSNGHPENKYVASEQDASDASYIRVNPITNHYVVQYNAAGFKGPPILQPNKFEYLQRIAFRLGRDIRDILADIGHPHDTDELKSNQEMSVRKAFRTLEYVSQEHICLQQLALDLHKVAPDLAAEDPNLLEIIKNDPASLSEKDAGSLIQMELIQEINNNWESRFPENEHVWDFAAHRVAKVVLPNSKRTVKPEVPRFFDMQRWPLPCQGKGNQEKTEPSRVIQEENVSDNCSKDKDEPDDSEQPHSWRQLQSEARRKPAERWTGRSQAPCFPFGETPYQQAYMSFMMEQDLMDVEEFNPKPPRNVSWAMKFKNLFTPTPLIEATDPTALPEVRGWVPDSVSEAHKRYVIAERKLATPGYPGEEEFYFTPQEIAERRRRKEALDMHLRHMDARRAVEELYAKRERAAVSYDDLTRAEKRAAWDELNIDPLREVERTPSPVSRVGSKRPASTTEGTRKRARL